MIPFLYNTTPFPSPDTASEEGIVAFGGKISTDRLISAYSQGIFPWYNEGDPILWWSPDPRMVLFPKELKISKSMKTLFRKNAFQVTYNTSFGEIIKNCAFIKRKSEDGTWIHPNFIEKYTELHHLGYAHSVEVWQNDEIVGGLYGIKLGKIFCGESMFAKVSNASKYGFIKFVQDFNDLCLIDCQAYTNHLASLGAREIPRSQFLEILKRHK